MTRSRVRVWLVVGLLVTLMTMLSGCTTALLLDGTQRLALPAVAGAADTLPAPGNRLLIQGADGNIYTAAPNGRDRFALTDDASDNKQYLQATWSPDGERIAWAEIAGDGGETTNRLAMVAHDGSAKADAEVPFAPFYIYWSPDNSRLAYLSNWQRSSLASMALRLTEAPTDLADAGSLEVTTVAEGQPFYFSWSPDSEQMFAHIGAERLAFQALDGEQMALDVLAAAFPAPQWAATGDALAYAINDEGQQRLVIAGLDGSVMNEVTDFYDRVTFSLSPDSRRIAFVETSDEVGIAALGPLFVVDLDRMQTRELSADPVIAFFWSPDGRKLAYMTAEPTARNPFTFRWHVWDGETRQAYSAFTPSRTFFQSYLTFFDQYAQSMTLWSPDSSAFAYAGTGDGRFGIWVQSLAADVEPVYAGRGVMVSWSPR